MLFLPLSVRQTLGKRGVADFDAQLAAETGVAAFRVAFARWIADATGDRSLGDHITEAASALRVLAGGE
jgi:hypothetical protein